MQLDGPRFFRLALRLTAYAGVMQARAVALEEERNGRGHHAAPTPSGAPMPTRQDDNTPRVVDADVARSVLMS